MMNYWVVKARPQQNDLEKILRADHGRWWSRWKPPVVRGDRVFVWAASPRLRIEGLAEVGASKPSQNRGDKRWHYLLRYKTDAFQRPIGIAELRRHDALRSATFLKPGPMGTFHPISKSQAAAIFALAVEAHPEIGSLWPELQRAPKKVSTAIGRLGRLKRRASPDPLEDVTAAAARLRAVSKTTREQLVQARLGQGAFRDALLKQWKGCAVTGCSVRDALRASHIKPWRSSRKKERLDVDNGLLLVANLDAMFDAGLVSFDDSGRMLVSGRLNKAERALVGIRRGMRLRRMARGTRRYLRWHRAHVYEGLKPR